MKNILHIKYFFFLSFCLIILISCKIDTSVGKGDPDYIKGIKAWHEKRIGNLKEENGWLNLAGLFRLKIGENTFGSDPSNNFVFPEGKIHAFAGSFILSDTIVTIKIKSQVSIFNNKQKVTEMELRTDAGGQPTILSHGSLRWFIIKRGEGFFVRLRDLEAQLVKEFEGIETFDINDDWRIDAMFESYENPKLISIPNILGTIEQDVAPGLLRFSIQGKEYSLEPVDAGKKLFLIFADETNGVETYGAGRFLYIDKPDSSSIAAIDFNKAYNPPCAFTQYATCPLPPKQNYLRLSITAGEKNYGSGH